MLAAEKNRKVAVVELLRAGANVNNKNLVRELVVSFVRISTLIVCDCSGAGQLSCSQLEEIVEKLLKC